MAQPTQFSFSFEEVAALLFWEQGITEGRWMLSFDFQLSAGMFGPSPSTALPGAIFNIQGINLVRTEDAPEDAALVYDAAELNSPKSKSTAVSSRGGKTKSARIK